jgi:SAM-dependent methyltransferase
MTTLQTSAFRRTAAEAYNSLAPAYDLLTAGYCHDLWLAEIERIARAYGLRGSRVLDVACGTGKSFLPLARRGYEITACDLSSEMVAIAREKGSEASITVEDMRELPDLGRFDLITCLDDAVNYLLAEAELAGFFDGVARNLADGGVAVFDVNSLRLYQEDFPRAWTLDDPAAFIVWTAAVPANVDRGARVAATVEVFAPQGDLWVRSSSRHEQRHWDRDDLERTAAEAGLRVLAVFGQHRGARLEPEFDEFVHTKALYLVNHDREAAKEMRIVGP